MSDVKCPECGSDATRIKFDKNEFSTYRCDECGHEFKLPPETELICIPTGP